MRFNGSRARILYRGNSQRRGEEGGRVMARDTKRTRTDGVTGHQQVRACRRRAQSRNAAKKWRGEKRVKEERGRERERDGCHGNSSQRFLFSLSIFLARALSLTHIHTQKHTSPCLFLHLPAPSSELQSTSFYRNTSMCCSS